jgi:hypothetical protein
VGALPPPFLKNQEIAMQTQLIATLIAFAALGSGSWASAQNAPGSDPIVIQGKVTFVPLPLKNPIPASQPLDPSPQLPPGLQAMIARFEADAYNALGSGSGTIQTGKDVVSVQTGNALQRTCTTNVASNIAGPSTTGGAVSPSGSPIGPNPAAAGPTGQLGSAITNQIAVLQGNLVTICN